MQLTSDQILYPTGMLVSISVPLLRCGAHVVLIGILTIYCYSRQGYFITLLKVNKFILYVAACDEIPLALPLNTTD